MQQTIIPPACLGIVGGGQLGMMFAISARQMGYRVAVLEPDPECPAKYFANHHIVAQYNDEHALNKLAKLSAVITTEFENVPAQSMEYLNKYVAVYPNANSIRCAQDRLREKDFFNANGIRTTRYCPILTLNDIQQVAGDMFPAILKTTTLGYDGKGQVKVNSIEELGAAFAKLNHVPCILEKMVELKQEVSVILARNHYEKIAYPVVQNIHKNGILDITIAGAKIDKAELIAKAGLNIIEALDYIGVLAIEFFITKDGDVLANEMAPRPHNSGHYTIDAVATSQFEQQVRSTCNLKLGDTHLKSPAIMLNLMGDIWQDALTHPHWNKILGKYANLKLHLYDKLEARPGRKMGHLTITGNDTEVLLNQIEQIKSDLGIG